MKVMVVLLVVGFKLKVVVRVGVGVDNIDVKVVIE